MKLGTIERIDYSWQELKIVSHPIEGFMTKFLLVTPDDAYDIDIEADDINMDDTVTMEWSIEVGLTDINWIRSLTDR